MLGGSRWGSNFPKKQYKFKKHQEKMENLEIGGGGLYG